MESILDTVKIWLGWSALIRLSRATGRGTPLPPHLEALPAEIWNHILTETVNHTDARLVARLILALQYNAHTLFKSITNLLYTKKIPRTHLPHNTSFAQCTPVSDVKKFTSLFPKLTGLSVWIGIWDVPGLYRLPAQLRSLTLTMSDQNLFGRNTVPENDFKFLYGLTNLEELIIDCRPNNTSSRSENRNLMNLKHAFASFSTAHSSNLPRSLKILRFLHNQPANLVLADPLPPNLTAFENQAKCAFIFKAKGALPRNIVELRLPEARGSFALLVGSLAEQLPPTLRIISVHCSSPSALISAADAAAWPPDLKTLRINFAQGIHFANLFTEEIWKVAPKNIEHLALVNYPVPTELPQGLKTLSSNFPVHDIQITDAYPNFPNTLEELEITNRAYGGPLRLSAAFVQSMPPRLRVLRRSVSVFKFDRNAWESLSGTLKDYFAENHRNSVVRKISSDWN